MWVYTTERAALKFIKWITTKPLRIKVSNPESHTISLLQSKRRAVSFAFCYLPERRLLQNKVPRRRITRVPPPKQIVVVTARGANRLELVPGESGRHVCFARRLPHQHLEIHYVSLFALIPRISVGRTHHEEAAAWRAAASGDLLQELLTRPGIGGGALIAAVKSVDQLHFQAHRVKIALHFGPHMF